ncbi:hypothetical protein CF319_g6976 [Tilletia indica]|nr:hypothetical protein CF319_g6976 [Tilletia indica]
MPARSRRYISNRQRDHHWQAERHLNCVESTTLNHGAGVTSDESQVLPQTLSAMPAGCIDLPVDTRLITIGPKSLSSLAGL